MKTKNPQLFLHIRVTKKLMKIINDEAGKLGLTISAYVRMIILKSHNDLKNLVDVRKG